MIHNFGLHCQVGRNQIPFTTSNVTANVCALSLFDRIGLQCSRLRFPEEVTRPLQLEGPSDDRPTRGETEAEDLTMGSRGTVVHFEGASYGEEEGMSGGLLVTAGTPWWRSTRP